MDSPKGFARQLRLVEAAAPAAEAGAGSVEEAIALLDVVAGHRHDVEGTLASIEVLVRRLRDDSERVAEAKGTLALTSPPLLREAMRRRSEQGAQA